MNDGLCRIWEEVVVVYLKAISYSCAGPESFSPENEIGTF
jgi:hypothetical protein